MSDKENQGMAAVGFLVLAFTDEKAGDEALKAMKEAKKQKTFYFENAAVIRQDKGGKVHYQETGDMKSGKGAGIGALIGGVLGVLGGPGGVALGASAGAAVGAAAAHKDAGFRDESLKTVGQALKPGTSAVVAITSEDFLKAYRKEVPLEETRAFVRNLSAHITDRLNAGKSLALAILLAEAGLVLKEVAVDENSAEVTALAVSEDAIAAGKVIATAGQVDYAVMGATGEAAFMEAGTVTEEGALIVDDVITPEGELLAATAILPEGEAEESEPKPAEDEGTETKPAEA